MTTAMNDMELWKAALEALQLELDILNAEIQQTRIKLNNMEKVVNHET